MPASPSEEHLQPPVLQDKWQKDLEPLVGNLQVTIGSGNISIVCDGGQPSGVDGERYKVTLANRHPKANRLTLPGVERILGTTVANKQTQCRGRARYLEHRPP